MKYSVKKRVLYTIIIAAMLVSCILIAIFGVDPQGSGSAKDIDLGLDLAGGVSITYETSESDPSDQDMEDTIYKLQKRVEGKSTESQVYKSGSNRITVEIPGVTDANAILEELGTPGTLEFLDSEGMAAKAQGTEYTPLLTGSDVKTAQAYSTSSSNESTNFGVELTFTDEGATKFAEATKANLGQIIYIVYDNEIKSYPTVQSEITGGTASITNMESYEAADNLATYIRVGSIPLTLNEVSSNIVGAQLGKDAINTSLIAAAIGLVVLCLFMIIIYRILGVVASIAICLYTSMVLILISVYDLTLTLPGIAGIVLGIGMAVDANVIIYSRIREEIGQGRSVDVAITSGYSKATSAIVDGNITTLIAALVLYIFGTGPVKGFATTLAIGVLVSMFTALVITRVLIKLFYNFGIKDPKFYGKAVFKKNFDFLNVKKWAFIASSVVIIGGFIGMGVYNANGNHPLNFSIEFAGGSSTTFTFDKEYTQQEVENDIIPVIKNAANINEVQQQKVNDSTKVTFKTSDLSLEQRENIEKAVTEKFPIQEGTIVETDTISSSVSSTMRKDALVSVVIATICMLIYIWFRFRDIKFAASAVIALLHDVLVVLTFYALARVTAGTTFIACMLTIVGYSINGTIIIFDRVRDKLKSANSKTDIAELVNDSITHTLSRTINTNLTSLIMLVALYVLGVESVKEFALPLMVGIVCGAYSSIFITSALWYIMGGKKRGKVAPVKEKKSDIAKLKKENDGSIV